MKHLKRFIVLAMVLGIGGILLMRVPATQFRGQDSQELTRHYNLIKAKDINSRTISLYSDDRKVETSGNDQIWMSDDMTLMIPETMVNDLFQCIAARMDGDIIKLIKGQKTCEIDIQKNRVRTDDGWTEARIAEFDRHGNICLSVNYLADYFDYDYQWDDENNTAMLATPEDEPVSLPVRYDLRDYGRVSEVRDQGSWGTCWAFAALSALESSLLPDKKCEFSVDHLAMNNGFNVDLDDGGDYNMALAYMTSWRGPVTEAQDPYGDGKYEDGLSAAVHLQDAVIINERDYSQIKQLIMQYGAVQSAIYSQPDIRSLSAYYNEENAAYYYPESQECNHDIDIIGWDDTYPKENFVTEPEKDGAFICKNSWGADFGQNGFFYISYEDPNIGVYGVSYTGVEDADNYDRIYQTDLLGWTGSIGYNEPMAWFSSVYQTDSKNTLRAAGFYATDAETYYDIYLVRDFEGIEDMDRRVFLQSGYIKDKGYYTIPLENPQPLEADQRFAVIVQIYTRDSMHPIAIEYVSNELTVEADISDGESYMSYNGSLWSHMEEASTCNACLKAYTDLTPDQ